MLPGKVVEFSATNLNVTKDIDFLPHFLLKDYKHNLKRNSFVRTTELDYKQQSVRVIFPKMALQLLFKLADCFGNSQNTQE